MASTRSSKLGRLLWIGVILPALWGPVLGADSTVEPQRPNAVAFHQMRYGIFVTQAYGLTGRADGRDRKAGTLEEFAGAFDVPAFSDQMASIGVEYVFFTAWHKSMYLLGPNHALEKWLPGHTARRDLVGEIADALHAKGIRLVIYAHPNDWHDLTPEEQARIGFVNFDKNDPNRNKVINQCINEVFDELCERYGKKPGVLGFWWDSWYHNGGRVDMPRLRKTVLDRFPGAITISNYDNKNFIDFVSMERGFPVWKDDPDLMVVEDKNQTFPVCNGWWSSSPRGTIKMSAETMYRFLLLMTGAGAPGGVAWAVSPLSDGKTWPGNNQPLEVLQKLNQLIAPVRPTICGVLPSRNWVLPPKAVWSNAPAFVASRSPANDKEYVHVLKPPAGRSIDLPASKETFKSARLFVSGRPVKVVGQKEALRLELPEGEDWSQLDTVIELSVDETKQAR